MTRYVYHVQAQDADTEFDEGIFGTRERAREQVKQIAERANAERIKIEARSDGYESFSFADEDSVLDIHVQIRRRPVL